PGLGISIFSALLPVILLTITTVLKGSVTQPGILQTSIQFLSEPDMVMIISLIVATFTLGINMNMGMKKVMNIYGEAVKDISMLILIMGGAGALKQVLIDSGVSAEIALLLTN